jgi:hypothetical protein
MRLEEERELTLKEVRRTRLMPIGYMLSKRHPYKLEFSEVLPPQGDTHSLRTCFKILNSPLETGLTQQERHERVKELAKHLAQAVSGYSSDPAKGFGKVVTGVKKRFRRLTHSVKDFEAPHRVYRSVESALLQDLLRYNSSGNPTTPFNQAIATTMVGDVSHKVMVDLSAGFLWIQSSAPRPIDGEFLESAQKLLKRNPIITTADHRLKHTFNWTVPPSS